MLTAVDAGSRDFIVPARVTCLSFDIWRTLLVGNPEFTRPRLALLFELLGWPGRDVESLREAYLASDRHFDDLSESTGLDYPLAVRVEFMFGMLGIDDTVPGPQAVAAIQARLGALRLVDAYMPTLTEPDAVDTLARLRDAGYRLGLLSNTGLDNEQVMRPVLEKLGIWQLCDVHLFSSEEGIAKPNPEIFHRLAGRFGALPGEVLHVGDNANADYRAREAGLSSVLYAPQGAPSHEAIHSLRELLPA
ncbi:HAD family hydrolase [Microbacterium sp.]|uniref:HAD family hydrolase n=1 Tax=Microbacterium sp. TaxID=51671 RepID=UPI003C762804